MKCKHLTDAEARAYIVGEQPFDFEKWEREHIKKLCKSVTEHIKIYGFRNKQNLMFTVSKYIDNHANNADVYKLKNLYKIIERTEEIK